LEDKRLSKVSTQVAFMQELNRAGTLWEEYRQSAFVEIFSAFSSRSGHYSGGICEVSKRRSSRLNLFAVIPARICPRLQQCANQFFATLS
jgi:hypothetical protein